MAWDKLSDDLVLTFGKFQGQTIGYVRRWSPDWLKWACSEVKGFAAGEYGTKREQYNVPRKVLAMVYDHKGREVWYTK